MHSLCDSPLSAMFLSSRWKGRLTESLPVRWRRSCRLAGGECWLSVSLLARVELELQARRARSYVHHVVLHLVSQREPRQALLRGPPFFSLTTTDINNVTPSNDTSGEEGPSLFHALDKQSATPLFLLKLHGRRHFHQERDSSRSGLLKHTRD